MAKTRLSKASFVERGYGQLEPNHLSAQRTGQIYAQLPAAAEIDVLENGQFVKYDYANGVVNFEGPGEWMLVYNAVKLYRDNMSDCDFAMISENYNARVYSPVGDKVTYYNADGEPTKVYARNYGGLPVLDENDDPISTGRQDEEGNEIMLTKEGVLASQWEPDSTTTPFEIETFKKPKMMPIGSTMVPRVFKTNIGDIFTTNMVNLSLEATDDELLGTTMGVNVDGILDPNEGAEWQVVKVYTLPDRQRAVKVMRIA